MKKTFCDICTKEIPDGKTPAIREIVDVNGKDYGVEIKMFAPAGGRLADDLCKMCVGSTAIVAKRQAELGAPQKEVIDVTTPEPIHSGN